MCASGAFRNFQNELACDDNSPQSRFFRLFGVNDSRMDSDRPPVAGNRPRPENREGFQPDLRRLTHAAIRLQALILRIA